MTTLSDFAAFISDAERTQGTNAKKKVVKQHLWGKYELQRLIQFALSPFYMFGATTFASANSTADAKTFDDTVDLLHALISRTLTGNAARNSLMLHAEQAALSWPSTIAISPHETLRRIINKDLRCGIQAKLVNAVLPDLVSVFAVQLAHSEQPALESLKFPKYAQPKYDGVRTIAMKMHSGAVTLFSRTGSRFDNFEELSYALTDLMPAGTVWDGEVVDASASFQELLRRAKAAPGKNTSYAPSLVYHVFDQISIDDWSKVQCDDPQRVRLVHLEQSFAEMDSKYGDVLDGVSARYNREPSIVMCPTKLCTNLSELMAYYDKMVSEGKEGLIIKEPDGIYTFRRDKNWQKLKPHSTIDMTIASFAYGTGKNSDVLGAVTCKGFDGEGRLIVSDVGTGFDDETRKLFADLYANGKLLGMIIEVRYQEITASVETREAKSNEYSLRFPSFVRLRGTEVGEKI